MIHFISQHFYELNRRRYELELAIQKRKAMGYVIAITILVTISTLCWIIRPVPFGNGQGVFLEKSSFDNKTPVVQTTQGDR